MPAQGERPQPPLYRRFEIGGCVALYELNSGLYDSSVNIFCSILRLTCQQVDLFLLLLDDVARFSMRR